MFGDSKCAPRTQNPNPTLKTTNFKRPRRNVTPKWNYANFRCLVIQNLRPELKIPLPPWKPQILNDHEEMWPQDEIMLILDVWWFKIRAPNSKSHSHLENHKL